ncbi:MAG: GNAT family N-acetyltransferase [Rhizomicrobium sp.]
MPGANQRRETLEQAPLLLIGRLALDQQFQGFGPGSDLLADALRRCRAASEIARFRGVIAHAIDDDAVGFYKRHGFGVSPLGTRIMLMPIELVRAPFVD